MDHNIHPVATAQLGMDRHRPKLEEFRVIVGLSSHDLPACREVVYTVALTNEQGERMEREHSALVYEGLLEDPEQVPWLVAHALRTLLRDG